MDKYSWKSMEDVFSAMNEAGDYLILRNYENIDGDAIFCEGHEDLDLLCSNVKQMIKILHAYPRRWRDNGVQYFIDLHGREIPIDLRHSGDRYYDVKWEEAMLASKRRNAKGFFVMSDEDYYYSLVYHAILQKIFFSEDYSIKLMEMASKNNIAAATEEEHLARLFTFMNEHNYKCFYPIDTSVTINFKKVPANLICGKPSWLVRILYRKGWSGIEVMLKGMGVQKIWRSAKYYG